LPVVKSRPQKRRRRPANERPVDFEEPQRYYEIVETRLRSAIRSGLLRPGTVLYEAAVADLFGVSRPPVKRALQMLEEANLIHRLNRRGYIVGPSGTTLQPIRTNLHRLSLNIIEPLGNGALRASWQRIYEAVEEELLSCSPFGTFQISEAILCDHYNVSRTVIRDVLNRIHGRGLIEKDRWSHWIAGPLSARRLDEHFAMRKILEPAALIAASATLTSEFIMQRRERLDSSSSADLSEPELDHLERDLHWDCVLAIKNRRLIDAIEQNHLSFFINRQFAAKICPIQAEPVRAEHRLVFECLLLKTPTAAAAALEKHIVAAASRTRSRLKVLSILKDVQIAPYLTRSS
jgi:DNA-binding GntR family transcriptional regulator